MIRFVDPMIECAKVTMASGNELITKPVRMRVRPPRDLGDMLDAVVTPRDQPEVEAQPQARVRSRSLPDLPAFTSAPMIRDDARPKAT